MQIDLQHLEIQLIDYTTWVPIQGNLKDLYSDNYDKLKKSFQEKGGFVPAFIWKHEGQNKILDAHQRKRLFDKEGATFKHPDGTVDKKYPCVVIEADNLQDAKEKLLIISSQYGRITQEGLDVFAVDLDDEWIAETAHFDAIFTEEPPIELETKEETDLSDDYTESFEVILSLSNEQEQEQAYNKMIELGYKCRVLTL